MDNIELYIEEAYKSGESLTKLGKRIGICRKVLAKIAWSKNLDFKRLKGTRNKTRLVGKKLGKLTIESFHSTGKKWSMWNCKCDCGNTKVLPVSALNKRGVKSCGCLVHKKGKDTVGWRGYEGISGTKWNGIQTSAKKRNIIFDISIEDGWQQFLNQNKKCSLTGFEISLDKSSKHSASLDRIDSTKGYIKGNIQWVTKEVNIAKQTLSQNDFIALCESVYKYSIRLT